MIQLKDGSFARVTDGKIYTRESLHSGSWVPIGTGSGFTQVLQLQDGTFASIRTVYGVFTSSVLHGTWSPIINPVPECHQFIQLTNGSFACVASGNVYTRDSLHSGSWVKSVS